MNKSEMIMGKITQTLKNLPAHTMNLPGNVAKLKNRVLFNNAFNAASYAARGVKVPHRNLGGTMKNIGKGLALPTGVAVGGAVAAKRMLGNEDSAE